MLKQPDISLDTRESLEVLSSAQLMTEEQKILKQQISAILDEEPEKVQRQIEEGLVFLSYNNNELVGFITLALRGDYCIASTHGKGIEELVTAAQNRFPDKIIYQK